MTGRSGSRTAARRVGRLLVALTMVAGVTAALATPAHAQQFIEMNDGFEDVFGNRVFVDSGDGDGYVEGDSPHPRTGDNNGALLADSGWSGVRRSVGLHSGNVNCNAWAYIQTPGATVNVEIIDPATWNYIAFEQHVLGSTGTGYTQVGVGPWDGEIKNVVFRIALLSDGDPEWVRVDDMGLQCWFG